jgi:hypothetical protein
MATWPSTLPAPLLSGYGLEPLKQTIRTDMEVGFSRVRRISKAQFDTVDTSVLLNKAQMAIFRAWFYNDSEAAGGASFFDMRVDIGTGTAVVKSCRIVKWTFTRDGLFYRVPLQLEVR